MKDMTVENAMNTTKKTSANAPRKSHSRMRAGVLAVALLMGTQNAYAGWPVIDITSIMGEIRSWIDDTTEYAKEAVRWDQMKQQIDELRSLFNAFNFIINLPDGQKLEKVDEKFLVKETCGGEAMGLNLSTAAALLGFENDKDFKKQQQQICVNIRMMQNRKFNDSVEFLDLTIKQAKEAMMENFMARSSNNKSGNVQAADSDAARLNNQLNVMAQQWGARMQSYDAYIATMQENQNRIAKAALKGDPTKKMVGDLIQTVALKGALSVD